MMHAAARRYCCSLRLRSECCNRAWNAGIAAPKLDPEATLNDNSRQLTEAITAFYFICDMMLSNDQIEELELGSSLS